jgi:hypothetical protein
MSGRARTDVADLLKAIATLARTIGKLFLFCDGLGQFAFVRGKVV